MKKGLLLLATLSLLSGCAKTMHSVNEEPNFSATVVETDKNSILVEVAEGEDERSSSDLISVSLNVELKDSMTHFDVGDVVQIYYDGSIAESYPAQIHTVYAIMLSNSADPKATLVEKLEENGYSVELKEDTSTLLMDYCVRLILNGDLDTQVVLYPFEDREETDKAVKEIDFNGSQLPGSDGAICSVDWIDMPHFYRYGSTVVQYIGSDEEIIGILEDVCSETVVE